MTDITTKTGLDLEIMLGAHAALRRDLERLARAATQPNSSLPPEVMRRLLDELDLPDLQGRPSQ